MKNIDGKISIIMPAYNEADTIVDSLRETIKVFEEFSCDFEIVVVDDGSLDETYKNALIVASGNPNVIVKQLKQNRGKGRAIKVGFRLTSGDYIVFLDADMELHPAQIRTLFDIMLLDGADVVIGSKRHPNSRLNYPLQRKIISSVYFFMIKILFGLPIRDTQTGLKLFKYEALQKVFPRILVRAFGYDLEILLNAHRLGYKISEAPVVLDSKMRYGRITLKSIWDTWFDTMAIWYRAYILKYYDRFDNHSSQGR